MSFKYSQEQLDFLFNNRNLMTGNQLAAAFNIQFGTEKPAMAIRGVCNNRKWNAGCCSKFIKGFIPWNAGTKGQGLTGANKGSFKKGQKSHKHKPVGSERVNSHDGYTMIKVAEPRKWKHKHVVLWEAKNGPVPSDFVVRFIDDDMTNFDYENLELISRKLNLQLNINKLKTADLAVKPIIRMYSKIQVAIYEKKQSEAHG